MKKVFFLFIISFIFIGSINAYASYFPENPIDNSNAKPITTEDYNFNVIKGISDGESLINSIYYNNMINEVTYYCPNGIIDASAKIWFNNNSANINVIHEIENHEIISCVVYLEEDIIYSYKLIDNEYIIDICKEINLCEYFGFFSLDCGYDSSTFVYIIQSDEEEYDSERDKYMNEYLFQCIYGMTYIENNEYDGEVHFVTTYNNPISLDELKKQIAVNDETEGEISNIEIINNNYLIEDGYIMVGEYSFDIIAKDSAGNTTIQKCIINVTDVTTPTINGNNIECTYDKPIIISESLFSASDDHGIDRIEIIEDTYTENSDIVGEYKVVVRAYDTYENYSDCEIKVIVLDKTRPRVVVTNYISTTTLVPLTIDEIKKEITVYDDIDGYIDYSISDIDNYFNNTNKFGTYNFLISYSDNSGNGGSYAYSISVVDTDYPIITLKNIIVLDKGEKLTKEQILSLLKNIGAIENKNASLSSSYFDEDNPSGEYELKINNNGKELSYILQVGQNNIIDYNPIASNNTNNNNNLVLIISVCVSLIIISTLGIIVYKKRH